MVTTALVNALGPLSGDTALGPFAKRNSTIARSLMAEHDHHGWSGEELLRQHPDLRPEEVYAAMTHFCDHHDEMVAGMHQAAAAAESLRPAAIVSSSSV